VEIINDAQVVWVWVMAAIIRGMNMGGSSLYAVLSSRLSSTTITHGFQWAFIIDFLEIILERIMLIFWMSYKGFSLIMPWMLRILLLKSEHLQFTFKVAVASNRFPSFMARFLTTHLYLAPSSSLRGIMDRVALVGWSLVPPFRTVAGRGELEPSRYQLYKWVIC